MKIICLLSSTKKQHFKGLERTLLSIDKTQTGSNCHTLWGRSTEALNEYIMIFDDNYDDVFVFISYETENSRFSIEQIFQNLTIFSRTEILPTTSYI